MRETSALWATTLRHSHPIATVVGSYLSNQPLAADIPIIRGEIRYDDTATIKRTLRLSVPAETPSQRWDPGADPKHPLAHYGQRLSVRTGLVHPGGVAELLAHGWFLITKWQREEAGEQATIEVTGEDLARLVADDEFLYPFTPPARMKAAAAAVVGRILPLSVAPSLSDPLVPAETVWEGSKAAALDELCQAWPARWFVDDTATLRIEPPYPAMPRAMPADITWSDGLDGTVVARGRGGDRGAQYNAVVVVGSAPDANSPTPHSAWEVTGAGSPVRVGGPYGRVVYRHTSDLVTTQTQAQRVASALGHKMSSVGRREDISIVPDPSVQLGDVARVYTQDGDQHLGRVIAASVPLTAAEAPMSVTTSNAPGDEEGQ